MMEKELYKSVNDGVMHCTTFKPVAMPSISFGWTSPPFVTMNKTVTRRNWAQSTIKRFKKDGHFLAWSKQQRFGGEPIGIGSLTADPFKQPTGDCGFEDLYEPEGFKWLDEYYEKIMIRTSGLVGSTHRWISSNIPMTVVEFEILEVFPGVKEKYSTDEEIIRCVKALLKELP